MLTIEYIILILLYTSLSISLIFQWLCYKKNMESLESIGFTSSVLLLVISISLSPLLPTESTTNVFTLWCMILIALTTFLQTLREQKHKIPKIYKTVHVGISIALSVFLFPGKVLGYMQPVQFLIVAFLIISIVVSMAITHQTKPIKQFQHIEKSNKIFAIIFLILVPIYLITHYFFENEYGQFQIGFLLYFALIALAVRKIYDDLQRLSLIKSKLDPREQQLKNYGLTQREQEVASLILKGLTYQDITAKLFISLPTVKTHTSNIYKKCKVRNRNEFYHLLTD